MVGYKHGMVEGAIAVSQQNAELGAFLDPACFRTVMTHEAGGRSLPRSQPAPDPACLLPTSLPCERVL